MEFEKINIPYADEFIFKTRSEPRIENANKTFDHSYEKSSKGYTT